MQISGAFGSKYGYEISRRFAKTACSRWGEFYGLSGSSGLQDTIEGRDAVDDGGVRIPMND